MSKITFDFIPGRDRSFSWGRKDEEYMADFILIARRTLTEDDFRIFRFHFLLGADWRLCCRRLNMDRGNFFHAVYRIEQRLGRVFRELKPYGLFPVHEYFEHSMHKAAPSPEPDPKVLPLPLRPRGVKIKIPVTRAA